MPLEFTPFELEPRLIKNMEWGEHETEGFSEKLEEQTQREPVTGWMKTSYRGGQLRKSVQLGLGSFEGTEAVGED